MRTALAVGKLGLDFDAALALRMKNRQKANSGRENHEEEMRKKKANKSTSPR